MKRFKDYERAYNKCYELLQKLIVLVKETDGNITLEIKFTYLDKYPMLSVTYYCNYLYSFLPQEDGTFIISTDNKVYTMDEIEAKIRAMKEIFPCPINEKYLCLDELVRDLFNDGQYAWNNDNTEMIGFVGNNPVLVRQETDNKLLVRFLGDVWCPDVIEAWVKMIEHDKNNDLDYYTVDTYMFGVIENDSERKSSDFYVSFYYRR